MEDNKQETTRNIVVPENIDEIMEAHFRALLKNAGFFRPRIYAGICYNGNFEYGLSAIGSTIVYGPDFPTVLENYQKENAPTRLRRVEIERAQARITQLEQEIADLESQPIAQPGEVAAS